MINGVAEKPAVVGVCAARVGPVWKAGGEICVCILSAEHTNNPFSDHECSCGAWWTAKQPATVER
jgi:hypothetical protein